jgi:hypothetical protein
MIRSACVATLAALTLCGCVSAETEGPAKPEKQYRTGSNIPRREGSLPDGTQASTPATGDTRLGPPGMPMPMPGGR